MKKIVLAACFAALACSKRAAAPVASPLQEAVRAASASSACGRLIPAEWSPSLPVPALDGGRPVYKMFFYGRDGGPAEGFVFHHAEGDATLAADGRVLSCSRRAGPVSRLPNFVPKPGVTMDDIDRRELELYPELQNAARLYAERREMTADEKKKVAAMAEAFEFFIEDGRGPDYRELSRDFWSWVERNGGRPPGKP